MTMMHLSFIFWLLTSDFYHFLWVALVDNVLFGDVYLLYFQYMQVFVIMVNDLMQLLLLSFGLACF